MSRKERRAAEHIARKAARKAGFPNNPPQPSSTNAPAIAPDAVLRCQAAPSSPAPVADLELLRANDPVAGHEFANTAPCSEGPSPARLAANRANAQLSRGAVTPLGKLISSQNRTTHGLARHNGAFRILTTEDAAGFEALKQTLANEHQPTTATEAILINNMAESLWLAQRSQRLQDTCVDPDNGALTNEKMSSLYLRYQTTHIRAFERSLSALQKLRAEKRREQAGFEAQERKETQFRLKQETQHLKKQAVQQQQAWKDPEAQADITRLGMAGFHRDPDYDRLRAEFTAKYAPQQEVNPPVAA